MGAKLSKILDECIVRVEKGETIETCLAEYPDVRKELEPLLYMALSVSTIPEVSPSDKFTKTSKARLVTRLRQESVPARVSERGRITLQRGELATLWQALWHTITGARKVAISLTVALLLVLGASILLPGVLNPISPPPAMASPCTLSILGGRVEVEKVPSDGWQPGVDGMTLTTGTNVRTGGDAHAVLTFFDGSTIKLEPGTLVGIRQMECSDEESVTIVVEQLLGRTWSRVEKMGTASYYKIETPSATVMARGTLFTTDVDETGLTKVAATEGLVSVVARSQEVHLTARHQTQVGVGTVPSTPQEVCAAAAELVIATDIPAVGSVRDPTGSSTGYLPSGLAFNQITGSQSSLLSDGRQVISVAQPVTGEYVFALRYTAPETACFNIQCKSEGKVVFEHTGELGGVEGEGWLIRINLNVDGGAVVSSTIVGIEPLGDTPPEKIVITELAKERAVPIKPTTRDNGVQDGPAGSEADDKDVSDNVHNEDTFDSIRDRDTGGDSGAEDKNDNTSCGDTDDNSAGDTSDTETSHNVGVEDTTDNTGDEQTDNSDLSTKGQIDQW